MNLLTKNKSKIKTAKVKCVLDFKRELNSLADFFLKENRRLSTPLGGKCLLSIAKGYKEVALFIYKYEITSQDILFPKNMLKNILNYLKLKISHLQYESELEYFHETKDGLTPTGLVILWEIEGYRQAMSYVKKYYNKRNPKFVGEKVYV